MRKRPVQIDGDEFAAEAVREWPTHASRTDVAQFIFGDPAVVG